MTGGVEFNYGQLPRGIHVTLHGGEWAEIDGFGDNAGGRPFSGFEMHRCLGLFFRVFYAGCSFYNSSRCE